MRSSRIRTLQLGSMAMLLGACTMVGGAPTVPTPPRVATAPAPAEVGSAVEADLSPAPLRIPAQVVEVALESLGTPYVWGGSTENGFDCSGLIQFAYGKLGIPLPRVSAAQVRAGSPVPPDPRLLRPGDVLGFSDDLSATADHVGLYIGGEQFIHSSSSGVRISTLANPYWREKLVAARRIVD